MEIKMDKNTLRLFFWERDFMLFFSEVSLRNLWEMPYTSPIALHFSLSDRWRCGMVSCSQHLEREGRRENPKLTETLWGSQFASHFWFLVILFTSAHLQETTNPVLRAVHASSFSLSRWPAPAQSLFHPIANLKQVLALCVPPACHLSTQKRTARIFFEINMT